MTTARNLAEFLKSMQSKSKKDKDTHSITHTRIGDTANNIYGGAYICDGANEDTLYDLVYNEVIRGNKMEYLTEKQLKDNVIYIDLDFKYANNITTRQHDADWTEGIICNYLEIIKEMLIVEPNVNVPVYVMQKDNVNRLIDGSLTKDGIHIIIGMKMPNKLQMHLREKMMSRPDTIDLLSQLPLINNMDAVFDAGLSQGTTNAQLYGCRKPNHDVYKLIKIYDCEIDPTDRSWCMADRPFGEITKDLFLELCIRKGNRVSFELTPASKCIINPIENLQKQRAQLSQTTRPDFECKTDLETLVMLCISGDRCASGRYNDAYKIRQAIKNVVGEEGKDLYRRYTEKAYNDGKGSFNKYNDWETEWDAVPTGGSLSIASLHYWAKEDNPTLYSVHFKKHHDTIKSDDAEVLFSSAIQNGTEYAIAKYFVELYGDNFKCLNVKNKLFYEFTKDFLWEQDEGGTPLRNIMSNELKAKFIKKINDINEEIALLNPDDKQDEEQLVSLRKLSKVVGDIALKLEKTCDKDHILREISDLIKDANFETDMNKEQFMLPIKNGKILDMRTLEVTDRTILNKFNYECDSTYRELTDDENSQIKKYFLDLFCGKEDTMQVVLDILKSSMTGLTLRYIYFITGSGRNGKSVLFNILKAIFKKGMDVISKDIVLQKKANTHLNTEVEKLDKCRIGYTTELKEEDKLNEPMIKAITGGDAINVRGICKTDATLNPTLNLFIPTNELPSFKVEPAICDRMIIIPFLNKFEVDKDFEKRMIDMRELVFCYIMKHGRIMDKFELTAEMKIAKEEYVVANAEDYLRDFIDSECVRDDCCKIERDEFRIRYNNYCKSLGYKPDVSKSQTFTKKLKMLNIENKPSNGKTYYVGICWNEPDQDTP